MIRLSAVYKNHAVLQSGKESVIHGFSDEEALNIKITDSEGKDVFTGNVDCTCGRFAISIGTFEAGGPYTVKVFSSQSSVSISDIWFGEVWLAGGQSNMEFELKNSKGYSEIFDEPLMENVRFFNVPRVAYLGEELDRAEDKAEWLECNENNIGEWSAVGFYFAKALSEVEPEIKIGIVGCNWGGTSASCWISEDELQTQPETSVYLDEYREKTEGLTLENHIKEWEEYLEYQADFDKKVGEYYATSANPKWDEAIKLFGENKYPGPMGPRNWTRPSGLYESMLSRLAPYSFAGVIFYQGEEDDNRPYNYYNLLKLLIKSWRKLFNDSELPFMIAQLPVFINEGEEDYKNWPFIREAQARVCSEDEKCGLAVILETGERYNIHPADKETVGYRLGFQALHKVYGALSKWEVCGPEYDSSFTENGCVYVDIKCCDEGLMLNGEDSFIEDIRMQDFLPIDCGFEVAGKDGIYHPAKAQVLRGETGITFKLKADNVAEPVFARYFWKNYGLVRIFGGNGMPLAPFRTSMNDGAIAYGSRQGSLK